jgi:hypothetical protein
VRSSVPASDSLSERPGSTTEAAAVAAAGAVLGGLAGSLVGIGVPMALIAGANGAVSGWRRVYDWSASKGPLAFVLDSTWASATTLAGLAAHTVGRVGGTPGYSRALSERQNRHVYARGLQLRKGFAVTLGNVVNGAGDLARPRRAKLITDHEDVHIWQARWFGPLYPALYAGWAAGGAVAGVFVWATRRRSDRLAKVVESCAYYLNPFEWWAYSRDDHWPPTGMLDHIGWRKPAVRSFASARHAVSDAAPQRD